VAFAAILKQGKASDVASEYFTQDELATELKSKTGTGSKRMLRSWRAKRAGPP
jgi:hypothetical protein